MFFFHHEIIFLKLTLSESVTGVICVYADESSTTLKVGAYILIGIGSLSMVMGFLGCIGAIYEIRCLLGLVSNYRESYRVFFITYLFHLI